MTTANKGTAARIRIFIQDGELESALMAGHVADLQFGPQGAWFELSEDVTEADITPFQRFILISRGILN